jgi:hypothetical protein
METKNMILAAAKKAEAQIRDEQRKRLAAIMLEDLFAYSSYSSATVLENYDKPPVKNLTLEEANARRIQQRRCEGVLLAAHRSLQYLRGEIE